MDDVTKRLDHSESDPATLAERAEDEPGSFLDMYRTINIDNVQIDEFLVNKSVANGVIPASLRYEFIERTGVYRGVVKSTKGDLHHFNWNPHFGDSVKFVPIPRGQHNVNQFDTMAKSLHDGCDLRVDDEDEKDPDTVEKRRRFKPQHAGVNPVSEEDWVQQQQTLVTEVHPGSTHSQTPDDPRVGMDWHAQKALSQPVDGLDSLNQTNFWSHTDVLKAWGQTLQETAPRVSPPENSIEAQYMREVMGLTNQEIAKGVNIPPRHRVYFEKWKTQQLRGTMSPLEAWLAKSK